MGLVACMCLYGCVPAPSNDDDDDENGGATGMGAAMSPGAGGANGSAVGGAMQPGAGGAMQPMAGGTPAPRGPCDYRAGEGRWTHLPDSGMCLYYSIERVRFRTAVAGCRDLGTELPDGATLDALCDEIVLQPGELLEGRQRSTQVRVRDEHEGYHRIWRDRGATERALDCGLEAENCGMTSLHSDCERQSLHMAADGSEIPYVCLRPANDPPPPPGSAPAADAGVPQARDAGVDPPNPDARCDFPVRRGNWTYLASAHQCLYFSAGELANFPDAVDACEELGGSLPLMRPLQEACEEVVLRPNQNNPNGHWATKVRVRDEYNTGHLLWHDRGVTSASLECEFDELECGGGDYNRNCMEVQGWVQDEAGKPYVCLRPAQGPAPDPVVEPDMGVPAAAPAETFWQDRPGRAPPEELTRETRAHFYFRGDENAVRFECQLNDGPWFECESPFMVDPAPNGENVFRVAAVNADDVADRTPLEYTWTVDTIRPSCRLTDTSTVRGGRGAPGCGPGSGYRITFNEEEGTQYQCRRTLIANSGRSSSEGDWFRCSSPYTFNYACAGLRRTSIQTYLRATDAAGNTCESGPSHGPTWNCDDC